MRRTNRVTAIVAERPRATRFFLFARKFLLIASSDSIARTETQPGRAPSESNRVKKPCRRVCRSRKRVPLPTLFFLPLPSPNVFSIGLYPRKTANGVAIRRVVIQEPEGRSHIFRATRRKRKKREREENNRKSRPAATERKIHYCSNRFQRIDIEKSAINR